MKASLTVGLFALFAPSCWGFSPGLAAPAVRGPRFAARVQQQPVAVVVDISSTDELNEALEKAGDKLVVVDYSTSWCGPCKQEMPVLEALHEKYAEQGLVIVGVNIDNNKKKMDKFLQGTPVSFRIVHDPKIEVAQRYEPSTMPSSYFIGRGGKLRYVHEGFRKKDAEEIEERVKRLLAEDSRR